MSRGRITGWARRRRKGEGWEEKVEEEQEEEMVNQVRVKVRY